MDAPNATVAVLNTGSVWFTKFKRIKHISRTVARAFACTGMPHDDSLAKKWLHGSAPSRAIAYTVRQADVWEKIITPN